MSEHIAEHEREREELTRTEHSLWLWFGMLGGPMSGMAMVWVAFPAVDMTCVGGNKIVLHIWALFFFLIAVVASIVSWRFYERVGDFPLTEGGVNPRTRFMALVGLFTSSLALIEIAMQWIPIFFLGSCIGT
jgi:hypothetical protein